MKNNYSTQNQNNSQQYVRNSQFYVRNSELYIRNSQFYVRNSELYIRNSQFYVRNSTFAMRTAEGSEANSKFFILNSSLFTLNSQLFRLSRQAIRNSQRRRQQIKSVICNPQSAIFTLKLLTLNLFLALNIGIGWGQTTNITYSSAYQYYTVPAGVTAVQVEICINRDLPGGVFLGTSLANFSAWVTKSKNP